MLQGKIMRISKKRYYDFLERMKWTPETVRLEMKLGDKGFRNILTFKEQPGLEAGFTRNEAMAIHGGKS